YSFLTRDHLDQTSFLYHSMSLTSDVMVLHDENGLSDDIAFGVRAVIAPVNQQMAAHLRRHSVHGRFAVYEASPEGYFGIVDVAARYTGGHAHLYDINSSWLRSQWSTQGLVVAFNLNEPKLQAIGRWEPIPPAAVSFLTP